MILKSNKKKINETPRAQGAMGVQSETAKISREKSTATGERDWK